MSASPFRLFDILNIQADKVVQVKYNRNQKRSQHSCVYHQRTIHHGIMMIVNIPEIISGLQMADWFNDSNLQLRSRCPKGRVTQNIMFTGAWGRASTSGNQAFPIEWKCLVLCLCIYEGIACDFCRSEVYGHYCSLDKSLFTNLFSSCKGLNKYSQAMHL